MYSNIDFIWLYYYDNTVTVYIKVYENCSVFYTPSIKHFFLLKLCDFNLWLLLLSYLSRQ